MSFCVVFPCPLYTSSLCVPCTLCSLFVSSFCACCFYPSRDGTKKRRYCKSNHMKMHGSFYNICRLLSKMFKSVQQPFRLRCLLRVALPAPSCSPACPTHLRPALSAATTSRMRHSKSNSLLSLASQQPLRPPLAVLPLERKHIDSFRLCRPPAANPSPAWARQATAPQDPLPQQACLSNKSTELGPQDLHVTYTECKLGACAGGAGWLGEAEGSCRRYQPVGEAQLGPEDLQVANTLRDQRESHLHILWVQLGLSDRLISPTQPLGLSQHVRLSKVST